MFLLGIGLYLDLRGRQSAERTRYETPTLFKSMLIAFCSRRSLWHVGGCIIAMYTFGLIIQLTSENLPQWIPLLIDSGLGISTGLQSISADSRRRLIESLGKFVGNICGGVQFNLHENRAHGANEGEPEP